MSHYHDSDDLKLLGTLKQLAPAEFKGFVELDAVVGRDGAIPKVRDASTPYFSGDCEGSILVA